MNIPRTLKVLVVDDDECDRQLVKRFLRSVDPPPNFFEASDVIEATKINQQHSIDLVLLDMRLVHTQGIETLSAFRCGVPHVRLVVSSGIIPEEVENISKRFNVAEFISKDILDVDLMGRLVSDATRAQCVQTRTSPSDELRVFLVDDEEADLFLLKRIMKSAADQPLHFDVAFDGLEAMERLTHLAAEAPQSLPDLITLDLNMPLKDGFQTLQEIKARPELREIPIIIHSTCCGTDGHRSELTLADDVVPKPSSRGEFASIENHLREHWFSTRLADENRSGSRESVIVH